MIAVDRGMVDDHLPNNVLAALKRCQREIVGSIDDPEVLALRQERIKKKIEMIGTASMLCRKLLCILVTKIKSTE